MNKNTCLGESHFKWGCDTTNSDYHVYSQIALMYHVGHENMASLGQCIHTYIGHNNTLQPHLVSCTMAH